LRLTDPETVLTRAEPVAGRDAMVPSMEPETDRADRVEPDEEKLT
jgi:hypothetical protein